MLRPSSYTRQKTKCRPSRPKSQNTSMDRNEGKTDALHHPQRPVEPHPQDGGDVLLGMCGVNYATENRKTREKEEGRNSDGYSNVSVGESLASGGGQKKRACSACTSATFEIEVGAVHTAWPPATLSDSEPRTRSVWTWMWMKEPTRMWLCY
jgi:hypothetical protein